MKPIPDADTTTGNDGVVYFGDPPQICAFLDGVIYVCEDGQWLPTTPQDALSAAAALLAAAAYQESLEE